MTPEKIIIGDCELWHGDCRDVLPLLPPGDLILTDPPYGICFSAHPTNCQRKAGKKPEAWDNEAPPAWLFGLLLEKFKNQIVWGGNHYQLPPSRGWLSWFKPDGAPSFSHFELAWTSFDMTCRQFERLISSTNAERVGHPTQKNLALMEWCLSFAPDALTVCDPFMGSGTTGVACVKTGRHFTGIERERKYFDIACRRIEQAVAQPRLIPNEKRPDPVNESLFEATP